MWKQHVFTSNKLRTVNQGFFGQNLGHYLDRFSSSIARFIARFIARLLVCVRSKLCNRNHRLSNLYLIAYQVNLRNAKVQIYCIKSNNDLST